MSIDIQENSQPINLFKRKYQFTIPLARKECLNPRPVRGGGGVDATPP